MIRRYVNPFISLLELLNVKYTRHFSQRKYAEHPNKNNMLGLSQMLSDYKVESEGIKVDDKIPLTWYLSSPLSSLRWGQDSQLFPVFPIKESLAN